MGPLISDPPPPTPLVPGGQGTASLLSTRSSRRKRTQDSKAKGNDRPLMLGARVASSMECQGAQPGNYPRKWLSLLLFCQHHNPR